MSAFTGPLAKVRFVLELLGVKETCDELDLLDRYDESLAALAQVERLASDMETALGRCPICTHEWRRHDPEDGKCDAPADGAYGACPCGRDPSFHRVRNASLSSLALDDGSIFRAVLSAREEGADTR